MKNFWPRRSDAKGFSIENLARKYREKISGVSSKTWFKISLEVTLEIFERYLRARLWIENPFALDRWGQKFFKIKEDSYLKKTKDK